VEMSSATFATDLIANCASWRDVGRGSWGPCGASDLEIAPFMREILRRAIALWVVSTSNSRHGQSRSLFLPNMGSCDGACLVSGTHVRQGRMARSRSVSKKVWGLYLGTGLFWHPDLC
jgi:hypothetical protein